MSTADAVITTFFSFFLWAYGRVFYRVSFWKSFVWWVRKGGGTELRPFLIGGSLVFVLPLFALFCITVKSALFELAGETHTVLFMGVSGEFKEEYLMRSHSGEVVLESYSSAFDYYNSSFKSLYQETVFWRIKGKDELGNSLNDHQGVYANSALKVFALFVVPALVILHLFFGPVSLGVKHPHEAGGILGKEFDRRIARVGLTRAKIALAHIPALLYVFYAVLFSGGGGNEKTEPRIRSTTPSYIEHPGAFVKAGDVISGVPVFFKVVKKRVYDWEDESHMEYAGRRAMVFRFDNVFPHTAYVSLSLNADKDRASIRRVVAAQKEGRAMEVVVNEDLTFSLLQE